MATFGAVFELSSLDGSNGFQISGERREDYSGHSVASAGDVNGDGFDDVIIGAPEADPNGFESGASYVVFGQGGSFAPQINLAKLDGDNGFQISGKNGKSGFSVASAGDVNGDGFDDVIVGAPEADPNGLWSGASYVVFGQADGFKANLNLSSLDGSNGFQISGKNGKSGFSVASAGDVNGDGFDDVIVGAPNAERRSVTGASYVVFGKAEGFKANLDLSNLDGENGFQVTGEGGGSGHSVASAGDVNGDGFDDVIIGAHYADPNGSLSGASYVVFGQAGGFDANLDLSSLDGENGFQISGEAAGDHSGTSVSSAGDINGDGFDDVIVGAPPGWTGTGASYVVFGQADGFKANLNLSSLDGKNGFQISGQYGDFSGFSVAGAGDVNGDGFDDIIIGAFRDGLNGASYVVFGKAEGFRANVKLSSLDGTNGFQINGEDPRDYSGFSVAGAGDLNGDGFDDVIVGAIGASPGGSESGASYVVFGQTSTVAEIGTDADEKFTGTDFNDIFDGRGGDDCLLGGSGHDLLIGGTGRDTLEGEGGEDRLFGGGGQDRLLGGLGQDTLFGGAEADRFILSSAAESRPGGGERDIIRDFQPTLDRIDLGGIDAREDLADNQAFVWLGRDNFTGAGGELRYRYSGQNTIVAGDIDGDGVSDFQLQINGHLTLSDTDFLL